MLSIGLLLPGCSLLHSKVEPFSCQVTTAYQADGAVNTEGYTVNKTCLRGLQKRLNACYAE